MCVTQNYEEKQQLRDESKSVLQTREQRHVRCCSCRQGARTPRLWSNLPLHLNQVLSFYIFPLFCCFFPPSRVKIVTKVVALRHIHSSSENLERLYTIVLTIVLPSWVKVVALRHVHFDRNRFASMYSATTEQSVYAQGKQKWTKRRHKMLTWKPKCGKTTAAHRLQNDHYERRIQQWESTVATTSCTPSSPHGGYNGGNDLSLSLSLSLSLYTQLHTRYTTNYVQQH